MAGQNKLQTRQFVPLIAAAAVCLNLSGCGSVSGYRNERLFPADVGSVYVEMFDNLTFRRNSEYKLTDALAKRIEAETPYKIITDRNRADTLISGRITWLGEALLTMERERGLPLEKEFEAVAVVSWKNLKTGELLIDNRSVNGSASYSDFQNQGLEYASSVAVNNLAVKIVELMEEKW